MLLACSTVDDVWSRIAEAAHAEGGGVIATDADGTLWSGDVGEDLFHAFLERGVVHDSALEAMRQGAREHALSDAGSGPEVARRIFGAYGQGLFPEERVCELMAWCFAGWTREAVRAFARDTVDRAGLAARLHREVLQLLDRARSAGLEVVLVSASPVVIVAEAGARVGFAPEQVVAARPRYEGDTMIAEVDRPIPYAGGKVSRLREHIGQGHVLLAAFGDNAFDVALLAEARVAVAVRPKPRLRARASEVPGLVELSPEV